MIMTDGYVTEKKRGDIETRGSTWAIGTPDKDGYFVLTDPKSRKVLAPWWGNNNFYLTGK